MKNLIPSSWMFIIFILFCFSCKQSNNPYRSTSKIENMENIVGGDGGIFSSGKNVPVLRKINLQTLTIGKNRIEIEELMGAPEGKSLDGGNGFLWDYRRPVYDEASDKIYSWSLISFKFVKGLCSSVDVRLESPPVQLTSSHSKETLLDSSDESIE